MRQALKGKCIFHVHIFEEMRFCISFLNHCVFFFGDEIDIVSSPFPELRSMTPFERQRIAFVILPNSVTSN